MHRLVTFLFILLIGTLPLISCSVFGESKLTISWTTESEIDVVGFNLHRSDSPDGPFTKINEELIPPASDPFVGGDHVFVDGNVENGMTYYYQLETVDRDGHSTFSETIPLKAGN